MTHVLRRAKNYRPVVTDDRVGQLNVLKVIDAPVVGVLAAVLLVLSIQTAVSSLTASRAVLFGIEFAPTITGCLATTSYMPILLLLLFCQRMKRAPAWGACTRLLLSSSIWTGVSSSAENVCNVPCNCASGWSP